MTSAKGYRAAGPAARRRRSMEELRNRLHGQEMRLTHELQGWLKPWQRSKICALDIAADGKSVTLSEMRGELVDALTQDAVLDEGATSLGPGLAPDRRLIAIGVKRISALGLAQHQFCIAVQNGAGCRGAYARAFSADLHGYTPFEIVTDHDREDG